MRLYLSSFRMGERFDDLLQLTGGRPRVALVANALDFIDAGSRRRYAQTVYSPVEEFRSAGADVLEVDLRRYFGRADALADDLADADLLWLTGGNTFLLRRAMVASGLDAIVRRRLSEDSIAYGGESAGAVAACKSLEGIHLMDDPGVQAGFTVTLYETSSCAWEFHHPGERRRWPDLRASLSQACRTTSPGTVGDDLLPTVSP
jgi:dipeptidase E